jgi:hypothetical protein
VLTTPRSKPVRKAEKVLLIDRIEYLHRSTLDNFILQRRDPERPLSSIFFLDELTPRGQRPIGAAVNASMQIHKLGFQVLPVLVPRRAIHSRRRISLKLEIRRPQQINRHMME